MSQSSNRPRRSVLYMPGSRERALEKAKTLKADALILDLEDAVAPSEKIIARELVAGAVKAGGFGGREILVRINGFDTEWGAEDLVAAAKAGPDAVLLPKVETPELVRDVAEKLTALGAPEKTKIWIMMETPLGALNIAAIAASSPRLAGIVVGSNDLVKDLHAEHTPLREPIVTALGLTMLAARAYGLDRDRMTLLGYSNGANLIGAILQLHPQAPGQAIMLRGIQVLSDPPQLAPQTLAAHRALLLSGSRDPFGRMAPALAQALRQGDAQLEDDTLDAGHELSQQDLERARAWLGQTASPR